MQVSIKPDRHKAISLCKMAEVTLQRLKETDMLKYSSNTLTDLYDVLHKLFEAIALSQGVKIKGEGAHNP